MAAGPSSSANQFATALAVGAPKRAVFSELHVHDDTESPCAHKTLLCEAYGRI